MEKLLLCNRYLFLVIIVLFLGCVRKTTSVNEVKLAPYLIDTSKKIVTPITDNANISELANPKMFHEQCYSELQWMLTGSQKYNFKKAVFLTENCWYENKQDYDKFNTAIKQVSSLILAFSKSNNINYKFSDSIKVNKNAAIFHFFSDTTFFLSFDTSHYSKAHLPFQYNFDDYTGEKDWSNMFVTKLLKTNEGNCHSLPYLYKIISDEIGAEAYLTLAPNHIYLKHRSKKTGWYNTELTSRQFPIDGWIMASGYIPLEAIQNGIYMDTLSKEQNICLCLIDLAKGYERKFGSDDFVVKCCDLALQYYPNYVNAILLKAETIKKRFDKMLKQYKVEYISDLFYIPNVKPQYNEMEQLYLKLYDLGYREMPKEMYKQWLQSLTEEQERYCNKKINFKD